MKKLMKNSPKRKREFHHICEMAPPKQPVVTRWGTWLQTAFYYAENFEKVKKFLQTIEMTDNKALKELQLLVEDDELYGQIQDLLQFKVLVEKIKEIQTRNLPVNRQFEILDFEGKFIRICE